MIGEPKDLSLVEEKMQSDLYHSPIEFCKDVRLIFNNSKKYNTKKKSRVSLKKLKKLFVIIAVVLIQVLHVN